LSIPRAFVLRRFFQQRRLPMLIADISPEVKQKSASRGRRSEKDARADN